jgi:hypothetical protein
MATADKTTICQNFPWSNGQFGCLLFYKKKSRKGCKICNYKRIIDHMQTCSEQTLCIYPIRNGETAFKIHTQNGMA